MASSYLFLGSSPPLPNLRRTGKNSQTQFFSRFILVPRAIQSPTEGCPEGPSSSSTVKERKKKSRKLRPNFFQQTIERWSHRITSKREKFPWELENAGEEEEVETDDCGGRSDGDDGDSAKIGNFGLGNRLVAAPWAHGVRSTGTHLDSRAKNHTLSKKTEAVRRNSDIIFDRSLLDQTSCSSGEGVGHSTSNSNDKIATDGEPFVYLQDKHPHLAPRVITRSKSLASGTKTQASSKSMTLDSGRSSEEGSNNSSLKPNIFYSTTVLESSSTIYKGNGGVTGKAVKFPPKHDHTSTSMILDVESGSSHFDTGNNRLIQARSIGLNGEADVGKIENLGSSSDQKNFDLISNFGTEEHSVSGTTSIMLSASLPWERDIDQGERNILRERSNTELAEKAIPEPELRRLRNLGLRMKERTKVGDAGVTEALVDSIRGKWKEAEVVKLKFVGASAINMKRTHDTLERKTRGLVIWRSGSSVVLYRGMTYDLPCVQSYPAYRDTNQKLDSSKEEDFANAPTKARDLPNFGKRYPDLVESFEKSSYGCGDASNIDGFLDELGPRYKDWAGRDPLPVDSDLLPSVVPGYRPPLRLLPYKVRLGLSNKEMTYLRRLARMMPPHFALGRNKNHQGLAKAMVKLWEKSLIAKIAIKRGVMNTHNERMAEELKALTGGVLLSRNKEFIVFYRGNDFLPPTIAEVVEEREKFADARQDEEDQARQRASALLASKTKLSEVRCVAGTLAETIQAKSHWADEPSNEDREKMTRDALLAKHASLIRSMEKKLSIAKGKLTKAEKALAKVQEYLEPAELPSDLETLTDEERFLFRKIGHKMRAFLSLGRRGVFDGTIENMHLHWKYRELVKIIIKGKSFAQVKHVAISLEAESGGVLVSLDKTTKGYAVVVYRGKNYQKPDALKPKNLLSRRQALERSIELQRLEALKHHISNLLENIGMMKSELEQMEKKDVTDGSDYTKLNDVFSSEADNINEEGDEAYLLTYRMDDDNDNDDDDNDDAAETIQKKKLATTNNASSENSEVS